MEERRAGSKRAFVVAWLLTLGFLLAVGPFGSPAETEECGSGASCAPSKDEMREDRLELREWRKKHPEICLANACDVRTPTFCAVVRRGAAAKDSLPIPRHRDPCRSETGFRTARARR